MVSLFGREEPRAGRSILTVSELTGMIRTALETSIGRVWVSGEISGMKTAASGHIYLSLKDESAVINCAIWRGRAKSLGFALADGMEVVVAGALDVYAPRGSYSLIIEAIEPKGMGILQLRFEQLKKQLEAEGLFDPARKRAIPLLPAKIGIVTSMSGAVRHDMVNTILKRHPRPRVILYDVRVQGEGAALEIAEGIRTITAAVPDLEVLIVGRGGGSIEDLWAFNEEAVVRAIAASPVPVISAVGHETDFTLADFAADVRAKTPTDAATLVVPVWSELMDKLEKFHDRLRSRLQQKLDECWMSVDRFRDSYELRRVQTIIPELQDRLKEWRSRMGQSLQNGVSLSRERLEGLSKSHMIREPREIIRAHRVQLEQLAKSPALALPRQFAERARTRLSTLEKFAADRIESDLRQARERLEGLAGRLEGLSPIKVLERGYSITWHQGKPVKDADEVPRGSEIVTRLHKGELKSKTL